MSIILHITQRQQWEAAQTIGVCRSESSHIEGFIHCSIANQIIRVANLFYARQQDIKACSRKVAFALIQILIHAITIPPSTLMICPVI
ncbi:MAG: DUF952 domain-containing protein [Cyanobacteria bacterium CRU_2_1]|nr:DUF952 domain-containing protein [Cyanobacteria bacterium RU_5_0]NJR57773.1 DUF952 domain-containing protein [Cyanobacteria bacterium CRU_2_1]